MYSSYRIYLSWESDRIPIIMIGVQFDDITTIGVVYELDSKLGWTHNETRETSHHNCEIF